MLFKNKKRLLNLYNAITGKKYTNPDKLKIVTLENAIYMEMKNDLAFLIDFNLYLFEHQSTVNKNMPLRFLQYVTAEYSEVTAAYPEEEELKLSDAYQTEEAEPELELKVRVLNINESFNEELKEQCHTLGEYMQYVDKVRMYAKEMPIEDAVDKAIDECIREGILKEFLLESRAKVRHMSIFEFDAEANRKVFGKNMYEKGVVQGRQEDILVILNDIGTVPSDLKDEIMAENEEETLKRWVKIAARAGTIEEFIQEK